jgi:ferredoxin
LFIQTSFMADRNGKATENVPGKWYIDDSCALCRVCIDEAPTLVKFDELETHMYFFKQPENAEETAAAQRAMDVCPTYSIRGDGDKIDNHDDTKQESPVLTSRVNASPETESKSVQSSRPISDKITFAAFSPPSVYPGLKFLVDVWAHTEPQSSEVLRLAAEIRRPAKLGIKSGISLERGSVLSIILQIPEMLIPDPNDVMLWDGAPTNASFIVEVPDNATLGDYPGKATITAAGLPVAKLSFCIPVTAQEAHDPIGRLGTVLKQPKTAFASYSSDDRGEVLARVQGMRPDLNG